MWEFHNSQVWDTAKKSKVTRRLWRVFKATTKAQLQTAESQQTREHNNICINFPIRQPSARHQFTLQDHRQVASVPVYVPAFTGTYYAYPQRMAKLS